MRSAAVPLRADVARRGCETMPAKAFVLSSKACIAGQKTTNAQTNQRVGRTDRYLRTPTLSGSR
jgi:hypothetical protein